MGSEKMIELHIENAKSVSKWLRAVLFATALASLVSAVSVFNVTMFSAVQRSMAEVEDVLKNYPFKAGSESPDHPSYRAYMGYLRLKRERGFRIEGQSEPEYFRQRLIELGQQARQYTEIKVPFFEIRFQVADLGFIGGVTFAILLLVLVQAQRREWEVYCALFRASKRHGDLFESYEAVYTCPFLLSPCSLESKEWRGLRLGSASPLIALAFVNFVFCLVPMFLNGELQLGSAFVWGVPVLFGVFIVALTVYSLSLLGKQSELWQGSWEEARRAQNKAEQALPNLGTWRFAADAENGLADAVLGGAEGKSYSIEGTCVITSCQGVLRAHGELDLHLASLELGGVVPWVASSVLTLSSGCIQVRFNAASESQMAELMLELQPSSIHGVAGYLSILRPTLCSLSTPVHLARS